MYSLQTNSSLGCNFQLSVSKWSKLNSNKLINMLCKLVQIICTHNAYICLLMLETNKKISRKNLAEARVCACESQMPLSVHCVHFLRPLYAPHKQYLLHRFWGWVGGCKPLSSIILFFIGGTVALFRVVLVGSIRMNVVDLAN